MSARQGSWGFSCWPVRCPVRRGRKRLAEAQPEPTTPTSTTASSGVQDDGAPEQRYVAKVSAAEAPAPEEEERMCRYCFDGEDSGELISPCRCAGGQKYVHLKCLRAWQRTVLVSQPTHPDFYDADTRQRICNVCKTEFTCPPPTRTELLASFAGHEAAAFIREGCMIASAEDFSWELEQQVMGYPAPVRDSIVSRNWVRGAFLIVKIIEDRGRDCVMLRVSDDEGLRRFLEHLGDDRRSLFLRGRRFTVLLQGDLPEGDDEASVEARRAATQELRAPLTVRLRPEAGADHGEDGVVAVNLTRPFDLFRGRLGIDHRRRAAWAEALAVVGAASVDDLRSQVSHLHAGPCEEERPAACIVIAGGRCKLFRDIDCLLRGLRAAEAVAGRGRRSDAQVAPTEPLREAWDGWADEEPSMEVDYDGGEELVAMDLGAADDAQPEGRTDDDHPRLTSAAPQESANPDPLEAGDDGVEPVRLLVFWGYAGWSRCQLLGEIARGSWGLCGAELGDVVSSGAHEVWHTIYPRLVFAPRTEMSESYGGRVPQDQERRRELHRQAIYRDLASPLAALTPGGGDAPPGDMGSDDGDRASLDSLALLGEAEAEAEESEADSDHSDDEESGGLAAPLLFGRRADDE